VSSAPRPIFDSYTLPLARRRPRSGPTVSIIGHVAIALLVLWRGGVVVESAWGGTRLPESGRSGGRGATSWVVMPQLPSSQPEAPAARQPPPTVATIAQRLPVKLDVPAPSRLVLIAAPAAIAIGNGMAGDVSPNEPAMAVGTDTSTGTGTANPDSGRTASDIFGPTPALLPIAPSGAPAGEKGEHEVRFWIRSDGRVTRVEVSPRIRDSAYRRRFMEAMNGFAFGPAKTRDGRPIEYVYSVLVHL